MIVIADTTPLLYLSRIGKIELLEELYQRIIVPATVWHEAVVARPDSAGVESLRAASCARNSGRIGWRSACR